MHLRGSTQNLREQGTNLLSSGGEQILNFKRNPSNYASQSSLNMGKTTTNGFGTSAMSPSLMNSLFSQASGPTGPLSQKEQLKSLLFNKLSKRLQAKNISRDK
jgi:hypothetical protein